MLHSTVSFMLVAALTFVSGTSTYGQVVQGAQVQHVKQQQPSLSVSPASTYPGDVIFVRSKEAKTVTLFSQTYHLQPSEGEYTRFIPIPFNAKPGSYQLQSADKKLSVSLTISPKKFEVDSITVSQKMSQMRQDTNRINADQKKINAARSVSAKTPYFDGPFKQPAEGKLTTPFGYQRVVNGVPANRHAAIDIANKTGTPIWASNHGKVVLADSLYLTGNTIIIDHGLNVFSIYAHMSKLEVKTGQEVKQGQVIGQMGTTGFSTGPHLHYGMLIGNTYVNPQPFFEESPFLWK
ncbi:peptidase M23 [Brevibacillus reuszeri]|uniref:Metalloendopeptidase n=1 Tax=Brevibacillus reuszeri TaxID=54915 RepID=A0A0K9YP00_9BACL|nr:M23 family metallopeptidase [Brevibacillus reuszeri]KNB70453.1 metalloendopeptidase [Brevibacillus reuszeri]MED1857992.1 M23 family metallopeptidase [Brevibacillus reuszeri]GED71868.1 peptidase M23 [Brevibacillus reuszeri]